MWYWQIMYKTSKINIIVSLTSVFHSCPLHNLEMTASWLCRQVLQLCHATNLKGDSENWQTRLSRSNNYVTYRCNACQLGVTRQQGAELSQISIFCYFYAVSKKSRDTCSSLRYWFGYDRRILIPYRTATVLNGHRFTLPIRYVK